ncbi:hypothetical protein [Clostridium tunisiense]|uniref:hypothetical protein n=1 Tax=Clostridium tunisiense TaxID=219748 RepID=UPI0002E35FBD|nr:hypothetical protein [Clostridium tunisiense]
MSEISNGLNMVILFLAGFMLLNIFKLSRSDGGQEPCDFKKTVTLYQEISSAKFICLYACFNP